MNNKNIAVGPGSFVTIYTKTTVLLIIHGDKVHEIKSKGKLMSRSFWLKKDIYVGGSTPTKKEFYQFH